MEVTVKMFEKYLSKMIEEENKTLSQKERFEIIKSNKVDKKVYEYIKNHFNNLTIKILNKYEGNIIELMNKGALEGWCWETTETAILFMDDESYINRGNLKFNSNRSYYHSWINFKFEDIDYIFDPCLQIICEKEIYDDVFEVDIRGSVTAKQVKEYFINYITNPPKKNYTPEINYITNKFFSEDALDKLKNEVVVHDKEDPNAPMYRNGVGYKTTLENGKIKKLVAHYYLNG